MLFKMIPGMEHAERLALIICKHEQPRGFSPFRKGAGSRPEGLLSFIEDETNEVLSRLADALRGKKGLTDADANVIDAILEANPASKGVAVNRKRLEQSMNGNLYVRVKYRANKEQDDKIAEADGMLIWNAR